MTTQNPEGLEWTSANWRMIATNGIRLEVATFGNGRKLALCLHGFPELAYSWRHQVNVLVNAGYLVWAPNLRGYGRSDAPDSATDYRIDTLVADVLGLIEAAASEEVLLLGHDWGAALAWTLAAQHPSAIHRLVICNLPHPACFLREVRRPPQLLLSWYIAFFQIPWLPETILRWRNALPVALMIRHSSFNKAMFPDAVLSVFRENAARPGTARRMIHWYRGLLHSRPWRLWQHPESARITVPTLLIWGEKDAALSIRTLRATKKYVPDLTVRILPEVSHWVQQEAPEKVNAILQAWLEGRAVPEFLAARGASSDSYAE